MITNKRSYKKEAQFAKKYGKGSVIETTITNIIHPSQIVTGFDVDYIGRLSILNLSWCMPEGEAIFKSYKVGDSIECKILDIDFENKQIILSQKHLLKSLSNTLKWERIERGDEYNVDIIETFYNSSLVKTKSNLFGIIVNNFIEDNSIRLRVKVNSKLDYCDLLSFIPASLDVQNDQEEKFSDPEINFIEDELVSFYNFKNSILGVYATDEHLSKIKEGFELDDRIFSKEFKTDYILYIQFELGSSSYESTFRQNAIPYFLNDTEISTENEKSLLEFLSTEQHYWFKINQRDSNEKIDFSIYNEDINFFGDVIIGKEKKDTKFIIKNFIFGHSQYSTSEAKKRNEKYGSFLFSNKLKIISPYNTTPFDNSQQNF